MLNCKAVGGVGPFTGINAARTLRTMRHGALGFSSAVRGVELGLGVRHYLRPATQRGFAVPIQAFVVAPALLRMAQRVIIRAAPGRLVFEAVKRGGFRVAGPLTFVGLIVYSIFATWWAAKQTKRAQTLASMSQMSIQSADFAENLPMVSGDVADAVGAAQQFEAANLGDPCPLCRGRGTINWEGLKVHKGEPCPRCLGSGFSRRSFIWGSR